jgi:hypothetical protein
MAGMWPKTVDKNRRFIDVSLLPKVYKSNSYSVYTLYPCLNSTQNWEIRCQKRYEVGFILIVLNY